MNGHYTRYLHCQRLFVKKGDVVKQGQIIALVGDTGASAAPHLHHDHAVDPKLLPRLIADGLLFSGRELPGTGGVAIPIEQLISIAWPTRGWIFERPKIICGELDWWLPVRRTPEMVIGDGWFPRRKIYLPGRNPDGTARFKVDAKGKPVWQPHAGIDLGMKNGKLLGAEIQASAAGTVILVGKNSPSAGNWIVLAH